MLPKIGWNVLMVVRARRKASGVQPVTHDASTCRDSLCGAIASSRVYDRRLF